MQKALIAAVVIAVAGVGAWFVTQGPDAAATENSEAQSFDVVEMVQGNPDSPVEVIEYASFTCPHCASFHANQYEDLKANYIDNGQIRFVYREVYFDQPGLWASMIARCGGEMRFFGISNLIYEQQQSWARAGDGAAIAASLRDIGKVAGLSEEDLDACLTDAEKAQELMAWYQSNAEADGISSTPSFLINGQLYSNMSYDEMAAILDQELADAGQ
ncbi:MAG: DsbA family protein [Pseudomonadota bacterium]